MGSPRSCPPTAARKSPSADVGGSARQREVAARRVALRDLGPLGANAGDRLLRRSMCDFRHDDFPDDGSGMASPLSRGQRFPTLLWAIFAGLSFSRSSYSTMSARHKLARPLGTKRHVGKVVRRHFGIRSPVLGAAQARVRHSPTYLSVDREQFSAVSALIIRLPRCFHPSSVDCAGLRRGMTAEELWSAPPQALTKPKPDWAFRSIRGCWSF